MIFFVPASLFTLKLFIREKKHNTMTDVINATPAATSASPGGEVKWIGSAADVSRLINEGSSGRNNARIVMGIALGGIFP